MEIKSCPFCYGKGVPEFNHNGRYWLVSCNMCGATGAIKVAKNNDDAKNMAIIAWNKRVGSGKSNYYRC